MQRSRSEFDGDRQRPHLPLEFETAENRFEIPCSICGNKYYFDEIYDRVFVKPAYWFAENVVYKFMDQGVIDGILHGFGDAVTELGRLGRYMQAGFVRAYAAIILAGALILFGLFAVMGFLKS